MTTLPPLLGISPGDQGCGRTLTWLIQGAVDGGLQALVLREPHLSRAAYVELARRVSPLLRQGLILHDSHVDARGIASASGWGLHLIRASDVRAVRPHVRGWLGVTCYGREELEQATADGADYALIGPVFGDEASEGEGRPTLGLEGLRGVLGEGVLPAFAVGGICGETAPLLLDTDVAGLAASTFLFPDDADADTCALNAATLCAIMARRSH